jgi:hypothetical protein
MNENKIGNYDAFVAPLIRKDFAKSFCDDIISVKPMSKEDLLKSLNIKLKDAQKLLKIEQIKERKLSLKSYIKWIKQIIKNDGKLFNYVYKEDIK